MRNNPAKLICFFADPDSISICPSEQKIVCTTRNQLDPQNMPDMTTFEILQKLRNSTFQSEDGDFYELKFMPGLSEAELDALRGRFPEGKIASELEAILRDTKGFTDVVLESTLFDAVDEFGFTELLPHSITLGHDGFGNHWVLDLLENGDLGKIYFSCHDPAVLVIYCETIHEFLSSVLEFHQSPGNNYLHKVHDEITFDIWKNNPNMRDIQDFRTTERGKHPFFDKFEGDEWVVADLNGKSNKEGFAWGRHGANQFTKRHPTELLWVIRKKKKGIWAKLFGK